MSDKLLVCLDDKVDFDFKLTYLGCRIIDSRYTISKLISSLLNNSIDDKPAILVCDDYCRFYTAKECYYLGLKFVNDCLKEFDGSDDELVYFSVSSDECELRELLNSFIISKIGCLFSKSQKESFCTILVDRVLSDSKIEGKLCLKDSRVI